VAVLVVEGLQAVDIDEGNQQWLLCATRAREFSRQRCETSSPPQRSC
jgi:hypothetical protein